VRALKSYINEVSFLLGEDRRRVVFLLCLFLFSSFLDILGIGLIAPYVTLVINPESGIAIGFLEALIRFAPLSVSGNPIQVLGIIILVVFVLKAVLGILINRSILRFCFRQGAKLRANLLSVYQGSPYQHFVKRNSAEYIYNINLAASFSQDILQSILRLLSVGIVGFVIVCYLALQDVVVLILLILMLGFVGFGFDRLFKKNLRQLGRSVNTESRNLVQAINEAIRGFKEIRILGEEAYFHGELERSAWRYAENSIRLALIATAPRYLLEVAVITFVILVVAIFSTGPRIDEELIPTLSMFGVAALRLFPFANQTVTSVTKLRAGRHTVSLLFADLARESQLSLGIEKTNQDQANGDEEFRV